jgi:hypothetical protein
MKKLLVIGVIGLFLGLACAPSITANVFKKSELVEIPVVEYNKNGEIKKTIVEITHEQLKKLRKELQEVDSIEDRLSIYKKYNLIPQDVTTEKLHEGIEERAKKMGFTKKRIQDIVNFYKAKLSIFEIFNLLISFMCSVSCSTGVGLRLYFGLSWPISLINGMNYWWLDKRDQLYPSVDAVNIGVGLLGGMETQGLLFSQSAGYEVMFYLMIGFVGYAVGIFPIPIRRILIGAEELLGYSVFVCSFGLPFHGPPHV